MKASTDEDGNEVLDPVEDEELMQAIFDKFSDEWIED